MQRCSCCNARLNGALTCPRCQANLTDIVSSEQLGQRLFDQALQLWCQQEPQLAVLALTRAMTYKKTPMMLALRDFIIRQYYGKILALLVAYQYREAQQQLALLRQLQPNNQLLLQLQGFNQYLLDKQQRNYGLRFMPETLPEPEIVTPVDTVPADATIEAVVGDSVNIVSITDLNEAVSQADPIDQHDSVVPPTECSIKSLLAKLPQMLSAAKLHTAQWLQY